MNSTDNSDQLFKEERPPAFIYKILLPHVFTYLKKHGSEVHIQLLQSTLLIDPAHYAYILEPASSVPQKRSFAAVLAGKLKKLWRYP